MDVDCSSGGVGSDAAAAAAGGAGCGGDPNGTWTSLDSLCEVAAAVSVAGAAGAEIPTQFEEEEAFSSVHDMIHAAVASHGNRATLRQIYSACQARGRIAYRRSGGSRLITHNEHWKSQIRHALYTSNRFERTGDNGEHWRVTEPYAGKGFQVTKVLVPAASDCSTDKIPHPTIPENLQKRDIRRCRRIRHIHGSEALSGLKPGSSALKRTAKARFSKHHIPTGRLCKAMSDYMVSIPCEQEIQNICPVLGVKVPRKVRSGVMRLPNPVLSSTTPAVCSNSDDESACKANEQDNVEQTKAAEISAARMCTDMSMHTTQVCRAHCGNVPRPTFEEFGEARSAKQTQSVPCNAEVAPPQVKTESSQGHMSLEYPTAAQQLRNLFSQGLPLTSLPFSLPAPIAPVMLLESLPRPLNGRSVEKLSADHMIELLSKLTKASEKSMKYEHKNPE